MIAVRCEEPRFKSPKLRSNGIEKRTFIIVSLSRSQEVVGRGDFSDSRRKEKKRRIRFCISPRCSSRILAPPLFLFQRHCVRRRFNSQTSLAELALPSLTRLISSSLI